MDKAKYGRIRMDNDARIDRLLEIINALEDARRDVSDVADDINIEDRNPEVSELLESIDEQLAGTVDMLDTAVQMMDED